MKRVTEYRLCIDNKKYPSSLEFGKIYRVIDHEKAVKHNMLRVIDEAGEDYLYPEAFFVPIKLPQIALDAFIALQ